MVPYGPSHHPRRDGRPQPGRGQYSVYPPPFYHALYEPLEAFEYEDYCRVPPRAAAGPQKRPWYFRRYVLLSAAAATFVITALLCVLYAASLVPDLPRLRSGETVGLNLTTYVYAADGTELGSFYRQNRTWVDRDRISQHVVDALVATEDRRFYDHHGVDVWRLPASLVETARGDVQGASTITMQLARNLYPEIGNAVSVRRKLREMMTAVKMERRYTKDEILEMYLNTVPFGHNTFGVEAAANLYFGKAAADLTTDEGAVLVGMLKGVSWYDPIDHPSRALRRRNVVLGQMRKVGMMDAVEEELLRRRPLGLHLQRRARPDGGAPYFLAYVQRWLERWGARAGYDVYTDGLRVYTTLDPRLQRRAQAAVDVTMPGLQAVVDYEWSRRHPSVLANDTGVYVRAERQGRFTPFGFFWESRPDLVDAYISSSARYRALVQQGTPPYAARYALRHDAAFIDSLRSAKTRLEAGLVAIDPSTGHVKAWVGGRNYADDQYDKVSLARRQPGSTFKPFVYAAAIDNGYQPYDMVLDSAMTYRVPGSNTYWRPYNAGGGYSGEWITLRQALATSKNTVTAQLMESLGATRVGRYAHQMGIQSELQLVPSLGLGTSEVTLLELTSAYGTFAQNGMHSPPIVVTRIEDRRGDVVATFGPPPERALEPSTAYTVLDMLRGVTQAGGTASRLRWKHGVHGDVAGKTGTTQDGADGWFVLVHPHLVTGVWVGFDDRRLTFRSSYWGQGAHNALDVAGTFFRNAAADPANHLSGARFHPPHGYVPPRPGLYAAGLSPDSLDNRASSIRYADDAYDRNPKRAHAVGLPEQRDHGESQSRQRGRIRW